MDMCNGKAILRERSALLLVSGCYCLIYQMIWLKRLSQILGCSALSTVTIVVSILLGLGIGTHLIGCFADRVKQPLMWYGICEFAIGVLALLIPLEFYWLGQITAFLYSLFQKYIFINVILNFIFAFVVIGPPCILIGGIFPLLAKVFTPKGSSLQENVGMMYATYVLGAAIGCCVARFCFFPLLGLFWSNIVTSSINICIGITIMGMGQNLTAKSFSEYRLLWLRETKCHGSNKKYNHLYRMNLIIVSVITGLTALAFQNIWFRQLSLILGGSTDTFIVVLFIFLLGISSGGLLYQLWVRKAINVSFILAIVVIGIVLSAIVGYCMIPPLTFCVGLFMPLRSMHLLDSLIAIGSISVIVFLPCVGLGVLFPLLVSLTGVKSDSAGKAIGSIHTGIIVGSILGAITTCLLLIPIIGTTGLMRGVLAMLLLSVILQLSEKRFQLVASLSLVIMAFVSLFIFVVPKDPRITNNGMYLYGYRPPQEIISSQLVLDYKEGPSCNVYVTEHNDGTRSLLVNGKVDATSGGDMQMQLGLAYFPRFLYPDAHNVLTIGFGNGTTASASLLFPDTDVACCEVEPAVINTSKYFNSYKPGNRLGMLMLFEDGRSHLRGSCDRYDLILTLSSNTWNAGYSNLFTKEFYEDARSKLTAKGIFAQRLRMHSFTGSQYALVIKTILDVFPASALIYFPSGDTIILASASSLEIDSSILAKAQSIVWQQDAIHNDLVKYFGTSDVSALLLKHLLLDQEGLMRLIKRNNPSVINTDLNMKLEYQTHLPLFGNTVPYEKCLEPIFHVASVDYFIEVFYSYNCSKEQVAVLRSLATLFASKGVNDTAIQLIDFALKVSEGDSQLTLMKYLLNPSQDVNQHIIQSIIEKNSEVKVNELGIKLWKSSRYEEAAVIFETLLLNYPNSPTLLENLSVCYNALGRYEEAKATLNKARLLDRFAYYESE